MKTLILVVAVTTCGMLFAAEQGAATNEVLQASADAHPAELEEEESKWFEAGFDTELFSAYVYRNAVFNDELVVQPCAWMDITLFDMLTVGGSVWQNWNLTNEQRSDGVPYEMNETDYNVHVGGDLWATEDEAYSVGLELGHEWFTYRHNWTDYSNEIYLRLEFDNPLVNVYGQYSQAYWKESCCHFDVGLARDWNIGELLESENDFLNRLTTGFDWNVNFGSGKYLTYYLYGYKRGAYDPESEENEEESLSNGIGGTTIKGSLAYEVCDHFTVGLVLAFTSVLGSDARDATDWNYGGRTYKDLCWGGLQAKLSF